MKLLFKQRFFSWFDSYDIYNERGETVFTVEGQLSWGHRLHILDKNGNHIGTVKQVVLTFMPEFELYVGEALIGAVKKKFKLFAPEYAIDTKGWLIEGNFLEWDYSIRDASGRCVAKIDKELWNFTDTYTIDVENEGDALCALMVTLAIDAEKCSRN